MIEAFRGDIPFSSCLSAFIGNPEVLKTVDPGLKIAGVTNKGQ